MEALIVFALTFIIIAGLAFIIWVFIEAVGACVLLTRPKPLPAPKDLQEGLNKIYMKAYGDL